LKRTTGTRENTCVQKGAIQVKNDSQNLGSLITAVELTAATHVSLHQKFEAIKLIETMCCGG